jgi:hypothetical protein
MSVSNLPEKSTLRIITQNCMETKMTFEGKGCKFSPKHETGEAAGIINLY